MLENGTVDSGAGQACDGIQCIGKMNETLENREKTGSKKEPDLCKMGTHLRW